MLQTFDVTTTAGSSVDISNIDLGNLNNEQLLSLHIYVAEYRASFTRVEGEYLILSSRLKAIQDLLKDKFYEFSERELGLKRHTARRLLAINACLVKHISTNGQIDLNEARNYRRNALYLLEPVTDVDVIEEVRALAKNGQTIDEATVRRIIDSRNVDYEEKIALAEAKLRSQESDLQKKEQQRALENGRLKDRLANQDELLRREKEKTVALVEELNESRSQATIVAHPVEIVREVLPAGLASIEEATVAAEIRLAAITARAELAEAQAKTLEEKHQAIEKNAGLLRAQRDELVEIKAAVESILLKFPLAKLRAISSKSAETKAALEAMGQLMIQFGNQLCTATEQA
ncbi:MULTISPECIES: hypothetical protein [Janthinobacterium]|uniref:hypothetical protein n=1 Tax=Janthinobacterium TaxID=29580 RepID=UPI00088E84C8|nr:MULTISPECIES: hypothetical protein [Janthinobacterium]MCC7712230.1 hypothetical protein [Janthinobacterium lividum]OEZ54950.1 hypothetical protein JANLI_35140 [Janthinobacterium lividum]WQE27093.1 hypothetical protein U0004_19040 [Janthinobacterium lividum]SDG80966.1 hypothetical protein SAMN05428968_1022 [Janthinobacterium sp. YR213]STQ97981.1 Uncharacterised protein [Janthinobacterium lividum]